MPFARARYLAPAKCRAGIAGTMLSDYLGALAHRREALRSKTPLAEADTLRLYEALANNPLSAERLARTTGTDPVAVRQ
ncbi:hypothetical protein LMG27177_06745 [Paraburkholderia fynbosensis]|uniref:Uncharacterized protein n=1 Tax=Paraburkholderia fynbosensis TaxID=1200993 RepID=A0A6J5GYB8_9BURK|nr:hypothetical protein LMG27177_06745 [Paraburkholderia fynbosensis]